MLEDIVRNILYGLIASSLIGIIIVIGAQSVKGKVDEMSDSKKLGTVLFAFLVGVWYIGLIWYWFSLLATI